MNELKDRFDAIPEDRFRGVSSAELNQIDGGMTAAEGAVLVTAIGVGIVIERTTTSSVGDIAKHHIK